MVRRPLVATSLGGLPGSLSLPGSDLLPVEGAFPGKGALKSQMEGWKMRVQPS